MKFFFKTSQGFAILSMVMSAFLGAVMGVWVRLMSAHFGNFQQIAARALVGGLLGLVIYSLTHKVKLTTFSRLSPADAFYIFLRSVLLLIGIGLFTFAIKTGNFSNVNMIYALPTTAVLGVLILKEKLTAAKLLALVIGFLGVLLITVKNFSASNTVGIGELAALLSTFFYSGSYITRRFMSSSINNEEIATVGALVMGSLALLVSVAMGNQFGNFFSLDWGLGLVVIVAGVTFILNGIFNNYGFERLEYIIANNLLMLTAFFGLVIGTFVYGEMPTIFGLIGGMMIIVSAFMINMTGSKKGFK